MDAKVPVAIEQGPVEATDDDVEGDPPVGMGLGVKEDFCNIDIVD